LAAAAQASFSEKYLRGQVDIWYERFAGRPIGEVVDVPLNREQEEGMGSQAAATIQRERKRIDPNGPTVACIRVQAKDLRPFILRRWSATALPSWALEEPARGSFYWRARSKEKLLAKAIRKLRLEALGHGIDRGTIVVTDSGAELRVDFRLDERAPAPKKPEFGLAGAGR
jgi:hypothetical protein